LTVWYPTDCGNGTANVVHKLLATIWIYIGQPIVRKRYFIDLVDTGKNYFGDTNGIPILELSFALLEFLACFRINNSSKVEKI
jgi:hypothetical protein